MHVMVNGLKSFTTTELLANLYRVGGNQDDLMEESPAEEARRKEVLEMYVAQEQYIYIYMIRNVCFL